ASVTVSPETPEGRPRKGKGPETGDDMTDANGSLPSRRPRRVLTQISPRAWEHPADRAALNALRAIPGVDEVIRKIYGFFGERGVRLMFQANAVRVGPRQFPRVHHAFQDVCATLDW